MSYGNFGECVPKVADYTLSYVGKLNSAFLVAKMRRQKNATYLIIYL